MAQSNYLQLLLNLPPFDSSLFPFSSSTHLSSSLAHLTVRHVCPHPPAQVARRCVRRWARQALTRADREAHDARWTAVLACPVETAALVRLRHLAEAADAEAAARCGRGGSGRAVVQVMGSGQRGRPVADLDQLYEQACASERACVRVRVRVRVRECVWAFCNALRLRAPSEPASPVPAYNARVTC